MTFQTILRSTACLIFSVFLIMGCGEEAESPQAPKAVRQKIVRAEKNQTKVQKAGPTKVQQAMKETAQSPADVVKTEKPKRAAAAPEEAQPSAPKIPETGQKTAPREIAALTQVDLDRAERETQGKIDPFTPLFRDEPVKTEKIETATEVKQRIPLTPLEKIDLGQLKLVAIVQAPSGDKALVEEATGKGYIVTKGTYIGVHSGRIIDILKDMIIVEEEVQDVLGKVTISRRELKLQKPPGEI